MKKILMLLCAGSIACSMCACGGGVSETNTNDIENPSQTEISQPAEQ